MAGPRIKSAGPVLESKHFLDLVQQLSGKLPPTLAQSLHELVQDRIGLQSAAEAQPEVDALKAKGVDFIKVRNAEIPEVLYAIGQAARRDGLPMAGHVIPGVDLAKASGAGQTSFEHDEDYFASNPAPASPEQQTALAKEFTKNGSVLVPTIVTSRYRLASDSQVQAALNDTQGTTDPMRLYLSPELLHFWQAAVALDKLVPQTEAWSEKLAKGKDFVRTMHKGGVEVLPGTDLGVPLLYPGESLLDELQIFVEELGMTPREALESATVLPAHWFGLRKQLGTVAPGKLADIVLLDGNPLEDIKNARKLFAVVADGMYYDYEEVKRKVRESAKAAPR
jgi:imidazolonepropionase-like amidohydrolase